MRKTDKFEWVQEGYVFYPDHTERNGRKYYADHTEYKNGKVRKHKKKKKLMNTIFTDGKYYIVPDYTTGKHLVIDSTTGEYVGNYEPERGVVDMCFVPPKRGKKPTITRFPLELGSTIDEVLYAKPSDIARRVIGDNELTRNATSCRFPSGKTIEIGTRLVFNNGTVFEGIAKYHVEKKYWIIRPLKNGKILFKNVVVEFIRQPRKVEIWNDNWIEVHYQTGKVFIEPTKNHSTQPVKNQAGFEVLVDVDTSQYVTIRPRFKKK